MKIFYTGKKMDFNLKKGGPPSQCSVKKKTNKKKTLGTNYYLFFLHEFTFNFSSIQFTIAGYSVIILQHFSQNNSHATSTRSRRAYASWSCVDLVLVHRVPGIYGPLRENLSSCFEIHAVLVTVNLTKLKLPESSNLLKVTNSKLTGQHAYVSIKENGDVCEP